jgi:nitrogenase molybdenum-iron protein alpha/beta subunit
VRRRKKKMREKLVTYNHGVAEESVRGMETELLDRIDLASIFIVVHGSIGCSLPTWAPSSTPFREISSLSL